LALYSLARENNSWSWQSILQEPYQNKYYFNT
jgi:hypothetical protein